MKENQQKETKFSSRSPLTSVKRRLEEIKIEAKESEINNIYNCLGRSFDRRCLTYISQLAISLIIIVFSIYKLSHIGCDDDKDIYLMLLSSVIGILMPAPSLKP